MKKRALSAIHIAPFMGGRFGRLSQTGDPLLEGALCAIGRAGIGSLKREGDGHTPQGRLALRQVFYRADREAPPQTALPCRAIAPRDLWGDDPPSLFYNRLLPQGRFSSIRGEALYRADPLYDCFVSLGFNDAPIEKGRGSAIFLHIARENFSATEGCVALKRAPLLRLLARCAPNAALHIHL